MRGWATAARVVSGVPVNVDGGLVLMYRDIGGPGPHFTRYSVTPERFRRQLTSCHRWGIRFIGLGHLVDMLLAGRDTRGLAAVAFDDCLAGVHRHAFPILSETGTPATLFAVAKAMGERPEWDPGATPVMTERELTEMVSAGFAVASHGLTHRSLIELDYATVTSEVGDSRQLLEDLIGEPVTLFAYPFGHHDPAVRRTVVKAGYRAAFGVLNGRLTPAVDRYRLPVLNMHDGLHGLRLARLVARAPSSWPYTQYDIVGHDLAW